MQIYLLCRMFRNNYNFLKNVRNTGFGDNPENENWNIFDEHGDPNVRLDGLSKSHFFSLYHFLLDISWLRFFGFTLIYYVLINLIFTCIYCILGLNGDSITMDSNFSLFWNCFFFSTHTLTTVGYGNLHPIGFLTNIVASFEMFWGLMNFAIMSGLVYGKFSKPKAFVQFSDNMIVNLDENNEVTEVQFRLAPSKSKMLFSDAHVDLLLMVRQTIEGIQRYRFYPLEPEIPEIKSLALNWTVVHKVDGDSPFFNFRKEQMLNENYQLLVYFSAYDEFYANKVKKRKAYHSTDIVFNRLYETMYRATSEYTILEINKINNTIDNEPKYSSNDQ